MAKKKSKGMTIDQYLASLSEEERFKVKTLGLHASYNVKIGILSSLSNAALSRMKNSANKLSRKGPRVKISKEQKAFDRWVTKNKINLCPYSVNKLEIEIEVAFKSKPKKIAYLITRSTLAKYLRAWKAKNCPR